MAICIHPGSKLTDGQRTFVYKQGTFVEVPTYVKRQVFHRLFLDNTHKIRCWTSDWERSEETLEQSDSFVCWLSKLSSTVVYPPNKCE